jgi:hypothetical protein
VIRIRAERDDGDCVFTILSPDARESFMTRDIAAAADKLRRIYGVEDPELILENAAKWGSIEVVDYRK